MKLHIPSWETKGQCGGHALGGRRFSPGSTHLAWAFTILEVIIACAIFFIFAFSILALVTQGLKMAKSIQTREPDPGIVLAGLSLSNVLEEGVFERPLDEFVPGYDPGISALIGIAEVGSNGLFEVSVALHNDKKHRQNPTFVMTRFHRPNSKPGSATKGQP